MEKYRQYQGVSVESSAAADRVLAEGGSPRAQLEAAKAATPWQKNLTYKPHCGAKERERRLKRMKNNETPR